MFFINFCFLSTLLKSRYDTSVKINTNNYKLNHGIDMRYPNSTDFNDTINIKIANNFFKMNLLNKLEDNKISNFEKIKLIDQSHIFDYNYSSNIMAGGLLDDFNFNF